jgi:KAP-like P-loop domain-containing protein
MWPDNETTDDLVGFQVHADLLRAVATNPRMLPTTIGVFGDWGGGKTSIMRMLERDLGPEHWPLNSDERTKYAAIAVVYANTWLFEGYDDAKTAILTCVLSELAEHKHFGPKVRDAATALLKSVNLMRVSRFALKHVALPAAAALLTGGAAAIPAALALSLGLKSLMPSGDDSNNENRQSGEKTESESTLKHLGSDGATADIRTFRQRFARLLQDGGIKTLVVLVDDLDRCTPERIIENLEAVKLFLSADQTAFVIGADPRIVEHAIRDKYARRSADDRDGELTERLVKDYLEKLVQVPYSLPRLSASEIHTYMTLLFCKRHLSMVDFDACLKACEAKRAQNRYGTFGFVDVRETLKDAPLEAPLAEALSFVVSAAPLIADGLKGNPRQVKRFLNALLLRKELARIANLGNIRDAVLVKLMILEYTQTDLFLQLFTWQSQQAGHPKELAALESALAGAKGSVDNEDGAKSVDPRWAKSSARRWVVMEPLLQSIDLRDYFWVARDRLESTFTGVAMLPPLVRTILDGLTSEVTPKRNSAKETAKLLKADEMSLLLDALVQRIARQPEDPASYNALFHLIELDWQGAAKVLVNTLLQRPLDNVPPAVGMQLMTLYKSKPELVEILEPAREHLVKSDTRVGKAAKAAAGSQRNG